MNLGSYPSFAKIGKHFNPEVAAALSAALLFGAGTPLLTKALLREIGPWMLAGLYLEDEEQADG